MTAFRRTFTIALLLTATSHAAEHDWPTPPRSHDDERRFSFSLSNRAGVATAPFLTTAFPEVSGFATVLTPSAAFQFSTIGWLHAKIPVSYARLDFPARAQVGEAALGNLELGLEHTLELRPSTRLGLLAALLAPSAQHGSETALLDNRALALASALNGGRDSALLTPGVTGLRLGVTVEHSHRPFELRASLDVPLLVRISGASLPEAAETHSIGILPAIDLGAAWWITSWFSASLGAGLITEPQRVQEPALESDRSQRLQPVIEPGLHFQLGRHVALALDVSLPVAGALGGDAWSLGLQGRLEL